MALESEFPGRVESNSQALSLFLVKMLRPYTHTDVCSACVSFFFLHTHRRRRRRERGMNRKKCEAMTVIRNLNRVPEENGERGEEEEKKYTTHKKTSQRWKIWRLCIFGSRFFVVVVASRCGKHIVVRILFFQNTHFAAEFLLLSQKSITPNG